VNESRLISSTFEEASSFFLCFLDFDIFNSIKCLLIGNCDVNEDHHWLVVTLIIDKNLDFLSNAQEKQLSSSHQQKSQQTKDANKYLFCAEAIRVCRITGLHKTENTLHRHQNGGDGHDSSNRKRYEGHALVLDD
jgi:hypothetical protein